MAKTQAEYQREYRARKKLTQITNAPETNAPETNAPSVTKCDHPPDMVCGECSAAENKAIFPPGVTDEIIGVTPPIDPACYDPSVLDPTPDDLPADVVAEIERMCSENNNGDRANSHSRAAMTERALHYQQVCGKR